MGQSSQAQMIATTTTMKDPPIVEALLEIRFQTNELPELVPGKLAELADWKGGSKTKLPVSDIPAPIRLADEGLRYQPTVEVKLDPKSPFLRLGTNVLAVHQPQPYPGWQIFRPYLQKAIDGLFTVLPDVKVQRLGLRYINVFSADRHFVARDQDFAVHVSVAGTELKVPFNLNFQTSCSAGHTCITRLASKEFVSGVLPPNTVGIVDVDVFTPTTFVATDRKQVLDWVDQAHGFEKDAFLNLLPNDLQARLFAK